MRIQTRTPEAKQRRIQLDPDTYPGQTFKSKKLNFYMKIYLK